MNLLIVDDNAANRSLLRQIITRLGHNPIETDNGSAAIEIVKNQTIDIVLMDIMMPGIDGYEATKIIKLHAGENHIPILFVTALSGEEALSNALESGGDDYISKPVNLEILESKIRAHGRIRELTQQLLTKNTELLKHNQRLEHEHELITYFFDNALARSYLDNRCIRYHFSPISAFNGDLMLSRRSPSGGLYLLLGDFTGHGLTAAMGTLPVAQVFFSLTKKGLSVGDLAHAINLTLKNLLPEDLFFAATIIEIDEHGTQLELWNGGMPESIVASKNGDKIDTLTSKHMPLGILDSDEFDSACAQYQLTKGNRLILFTDGVIEAKNPKGEEFGEQRLYSLITHTGEQLFEQVNNKITEFTEDKNQQDDVSLVEILCDQLPPVNNLVEPSDKTTELPWEFKTIISNKIIQKGNPLPCIVDTVDAALNLGEHKGSVYTVISEAYNNAVDYSILGMKRDIKTDDEDFMLYYSKREKALLELRDAFIKCDITFTPDQNGGKLSICLEDSGNNASTSSDDIKFQYDDIKSPDLLHGRGLLLISELCETVHLDHKNHRITLDYIIS